jgi:small subunit ribosomal protein S1
LSVGAVVSGVVRSLKDFGAFVDIGGLDGLLPASELGYDRGARPSDVLSVGQAVTVQVLRIEKAREPRDPSKRARDTEQITLSLKALERDPWEEAVTRLQPGTVVRGKIARAEVFGAFVEVSPGVEGLLHISELGSDRSLRHARDAVKPGDTLDVTVLSVDREKRRISLGRASGEERVDDEGRAAVARGAAAGMGTFGDLLKAKLSGR